MSERAIRRLEHKHDKEDKLIEDMGLRNTLKTYQGRRFIWWLLGVGRINQQPYTGEAMSTAFGCGELNVGNQLLARIVEVDPSSYIRMMEENRDLERDRADALAAKRRDDDPAGDDAGDDD